MSEPLPDTVQVGELVSRMRREAEERRLEHEKRMREDPAYRAEQERAAAAAREQQEAMECAEAAERRADLARRRDRKEIPSFTWGHCDAFRQDRLTAPGAAGVALSWARRFLTEGPREWLFLILAGSPGVGKTTAAAVYADAPREVTELVGWEQKPRKALREVDARFVTAAEMAKQGAFGDEAAKFWTALRDTSRLVIDDLGVERLDDKGWALSNVVDLLEHRHAQESRTLITTNLSMPEIETRYAAHDGGRLRDRLRETAWFVPLSGPSLRHRLSLEENPR